MNEYNDYELEDDNDYFEIDEDKYFSGQMTWNDSTVHNYDYFEDWN